MIGSRENLVKKTSLDEAFERLDKTSEKYIVIGNTTYSRENAPAGATGVQSGYTADKKRYHSWFTGSEKR